MNRSYLREFFQSTGIYVYTTVYKREGREKVKGVIDLTSSERCVSINVKIKDGDKGL